MAFLTEAANRGSIPTGFDINNSVKFEADNTEYMKFTSSQSGSDLYRMAFNIWLTLCNASRFSRMEATIFEYIWISCNKVNGY